jgi:PRC-barrel domain
MLPVRRGTILACIALLLTAAAPDQPASEVQQVPPEEALAILGHNVEGPDGKDIGRLVDILVGQEGQPQAAVIDFGGFMGVGSRKIAVRWSALHFAPGDAKNPITLELTPDQIKGAPEYKDIAKPAPVVVAAPAPAPAVAPEAEPAPPKQ